MNRNDSLHIRLSTKEKELFKQVAEKLNMNITNLLVMLVKKEQENNGQKR